MASSTKAASVVNDDKKISQLPQKESVTGTEKIPIADAGKNYSITTQQVIDQTKTTLADALDKKVDKVEGKVLSSNDFTSADKTKLDGIETGAQVNTVTGIKGDSETTYRTGNVNITKTNIGLSKVDNTSDAEKPVSTAQQTALDKKVDKVEGKVLSSNDYTNDDKAVVDQMKGLLPNVYGVEMPRGQGDSGYHTWIGKEEFKLLHPILAKFRLAKVKDGKVIGFFDQTNILKMQDGSASNVVIDGTTVTDDGSDIMLVNTEPFWIINGGTDPAYERRLVGDVPFSYGPDTADYVEPFGMSIDYSIIKDNKQRCIRDNTLTGTVSGGQLGVNVMTDKGYPYTSINRFNYELYARNKNTDTTKNRPYANAFSFDLDVWCTLLFIKFQTKDIHSQSMCGPGISSNDDGPNDSSWGTKSGVRYKKSDGATYVYGKTASVLFKSAADGTTYNMDQVINNYRPKLKILEAQLALSYAKENDIAADTDFTYDGSTYRWRRIRDYAAIKEGEMTAILVKFFTISVTGYSIADAAMVTNREVEVCYVQPIIKGMIAGWGNLWKWVSGIDCVMHDSTSIDIYQTKDVDMLTTDSDSADHEPNAPYAFELFYDFVGSRARSEGYQAKNFKDSLIGEVNGNTLHSGEAHYNWFTGNAAAGKIGRRGVFFGGRSNYGMCSLRTGTASNSPAGADVGIGGGFRVSLTPS